MPLSIVESSVRPKSGDPERSADLLLLSPHLTGLLSGVAVQTHATPLDLPEGMGLARYAATVGVASLRALDPTLPIEQAAPLLGAELDRALRRVGTPLSAGYALALVNGARREVWRVGPVHLLCAGLGRSEDLGWPPSLLVAAQARALILHALLAHTSADYDPRRLQAADPSRALIAPLLTAHASLANAPRALGYGLINGAAVPPEYLEVHRLQPGAREVVLASLGYPSVRGTLGASEQALAEVLREDPLLIDRFPYVRPVRPGQDGYADRAYVRVRVW